MRKAIAMLMALAAAASMAMTSVAESYEVPAEITIETTEAMESMKTPEIPSGTLNAEVFGFDAGQMYAVYSAPDVKSLRGANGKAKVSTNDWVQVFGRDGDWVMVQYDVKDQYYRIGYISAKAIPVGMTVPGLSLLSDTVVTMEKVNVTDDPLGDQKTLTELPADSHVTRLGIMGDWSYIEGTRDDKLFRGFVPSKVLSDSQVIYSVEEAMRVLTGEWNVYAGDAGNADFLRFEDNGAVYGRLASDTAEWSGQWSIERYDAGRMSYWNDPEFEITFVQENRTLSYGLRICWEPYGTNGASYALILSESERTSGLVLCK